MANSLNTNGMNLKIGITYSEEEARAKLNSVLNKLELKSTIQIPVEIDGERFVKTIRTYQDEMKNLVEETTLYMVRVKHFLRLLVTLLQQKKEQMRQLLDKQIIQNN